MSRIRWIILLFFLVCFCNKIEVSAQINDFTTEEFTEEKKTNIIEKLNIVKYNVRRQELLTIECFDVNDEGMVVIGSENSSAKIIHVYNENGIFQYAFKVDLLGSIGVEWIDKDTIAIYSARSYLAAIINTEGEVINVLDIKDDSGENSARMIEVCSARSKTIDGKTYLARSGSGWVNRIVSSFDELVAVDETGIEHTIYKVDTCPEIRVLSMIVLVIIILVVAFISIKKEFKKLKCNNDMR